MRNSFIYQFLYRLKIKRIALLFGNYFKIISRHLYIGILWGICRIRHFRKGGNGLICLFLMAGIVGAYSIALGSFRESFIEFVFILPVEYGLNLWFRIIYKTQSIKIQDLSASITEAYGKAIAFYLFFKLICNVAYPAVSHIYAVYLGSFVENLIIFLGIYHIGCGSRRYKNK